MPKIEDADVWVAHRLVGDITFSELILEADKMLTVEDGQLYSKWEDGRSVCLGEFLGLSVNPMMLRDFVTKVEDKVVIIPANKGRQY